MHSESVFRYKVIEELRVSKNSQTGNKQVKFTSKFSGLVNISAKGGMKWCYTKLSKLRC